MIASSWCLTIPLIGQCLGPNSTLSTRRFAIFSELDFSSGFSDASLGEKYKFRPTELLARSMVDEVGICNDLSFLQLDCPNRLASHFRHQRATIKNVRSGSKWNLGFRFYCKTRDDQIRADYFGKSRNSNLRCATR